MSSVILTSRLSLSNLVERRGTGVEIGRAPHGPCVYGLIWHTENSPKVMHTELYESTSFEFKCDVIQTEFNTTVLHIQKEANPYGATVTVSAITGL